MYCNRVTHIIRPGDTFFTLSRIYSTTEALIAADNPHINPYNLHIGDMVAVCPGVVYQDYAPDHPKPSRGISRKQFELSNDMRLAWMQHVWWTRNLIISKIDGLKDTAEVEKRLLKNPEDMANVFRPYYPEPVADRLAELFKEHLRIGGELITATKNGDTKAAELNVQWYKNADEIAGFMSSFNPHYNLEELKRMLYTHLDLTKKDVGYRIEGNYPQDIAAFNLIEREALGMADYFSGGIVSQLINQF